MVFRFMDLPRELRDEVGPAYSAACHRYDDSVLILQVYRYLFTNSQPVARTRDPFICRTGCGFVRDTEITRFPVQVLLTCRQIYKEGRLVLYHDNIWEIHTPAVAPTASISILMFNRHLFDSERHQPTCYIRFLDFTVHLASSVKRWLTRPEILSLRDAQWLPHHLHSAPEVYVCMSEAKECRLNQTMLEHLVLTYRVKFPQLQSIRISLSCHDQGFGADRDCYQLKFLVRLHRQDILRQNKWQIGSYEPRRQLLTPLAVLDNLQNIEVQLQVNQATTRTENGSEALQNTEIQPPAIQATTSTENGSEALQNTEDQQQAVQATTSTQNGSVALQNTEVQSLVTQTTTNIQNGSEALQNTDVQPQAVQATTSTENGSEDPKKAPKAQPIWTFSTIEEMLKVAGPDYVNFRRKEMPTAMNKWLPGPARRQSDYN